MSDYVTDPDLLAELNGTKKPEQTSQATSNEGYITDPELLAQLGGSPPPTTEQESNGFGSVLQAIAPAVTGFGYNNPTGIGRIAGDVANVGRAAASNLAARPLVQTAADVAGVVTHGVPWGSVARGAIDPASLKTSEFLGKAFDVAKATPGYIAGAIGPALRGVSRVAGPIGMGLNIYDAAKFAREAELGKRLANGEAARAPEAYRELLNQNVSNYQVSPQEATNLLASGDERTINIYGGRKKLQEVIKGGIQAQAASRILSPQASPIAGPVQPGQF